MRRQGASGRYVARFLRFKEGRLQRFARGGEARGQQAVGSQGSETLGEPGAIALEPLHDVRDDRVAIEVDGRQRIGPGRARASE